MTAANAIARILVDQVKTDEALETLKPWGDMQTLAGTWRIRMLRTYGHIYAARGEEQKSLASFREALRLEAQP
jgi:predicted negative regulator of RcsB-dependent stress response